MNVISALNMIKDCRWTIEKHSETDYWLMFNHKKVDSFITYDDACSGRIVASEQLRKGVIPA